MPKADAGFFLMAAKRGFAEREGLKVEVLDVKDDPIGMKALLSGEVDSYEGVYGAIAASARGADVKLLGCTWHAAPYVMLARPGITEIEDLKGQGDRRILARHAAGRGRARRAGAAKVPVSDVKLAAVGGDRDRLHRAAGRRGRRRRRLQRIHAAAGRRRLNVLVEARQVLPEVRCASACS